MVLAGSRPLRLLAGFAVSAGFIIASGLFTTSNAYGHPVSASGYPLYPSCLPLTIIKSCGVLSPYLQSLDQVLAVIFSIIAALIAGLFAFKRYLRRRDYYVVN